MEAFRHHRPRGCVSEQLFLHMDNAPAHTANISKQVIAQNSCSVVATHTLLTRFSAKRFLVLWIPQSWCLRKKIPHCPGLEGSCDDQVGTIGSAEYWDCMLRAWVKRLVLCVTTEGCYLKEFCDLVQQCQHVLMAMAVQNVNTFPTHVLISTKKSGAWSSIDILNLRSEIPLIHRRSRDKSGCNAANIQRIHNLFQVDKSNCWRTAGSFWPHTHNHPQGTQAGFEAQQKGSARFAKLLNSNQLCQYLECSHAALHTILTESWSTQQAGHNGRVVGLYMGSGDKIAVLNGWQLENRGLWWNWDDVSEGSASLWAFLITKDSSTMSFSGTELSIPKCLWGFLNGCAQLWSVTVTDPMCHTFYMWKMPHPQWQRSQAAPPVDSDENSSPPHPLFTFRNLHKVSVFHCETMNKFPLVPWSGHLGRCDRPNFSDSIDRVCWQCPAQVASAMGALCVCSVMETFFEGLLWKHAFFTVPPMLKCCFCWHWVPCITCLHGQFAVKWFYKHSVPKVMQHGTSQQISIGRGHVLLCLHLMGRGSPNFKIWTRTSLQKCKTKISVQCKTRSMQPTGSVIEVTVFQSFPSFHCRQAGKHLCVCQQWTQTKCELAHYLQCDHQRKSGRGACGVRLRKQWSTQTWAVRHAAKEKLCVRKASYELLWSRGAQLFAILLGDKRQWSQLYSRVQVLRGRYDMQCLRRALLPVSVQTIWQWLFADLQQ